ncbi:MAG: transcription antitermination factor NusB [Planctomyces sp.]
MNDRPQNPWDPSKTRFRNQPQQKPRKPRKDVPRTSRRSERSESSANSAAQELSAKLDKEAAVSSIGSGRELAWMILQQFDYSDRFLQELFAEADSLHALPSRDRAAAVDIATGVVRHRRTIDVLLQSQVTRPKHQMEPDLWRTLRIGVFQLVFGKTPDHAAVDSTVELCRLLDRERWTRIVNGVLRGIGRLMTTEAATEPSAFSLPLQNGTWKLLAQPVFPDPATNLPAYIADAFSLPDTLAARWVSRWSVSDVLKACFASSGVPRTTLRINRLRSSVGVVQQMLQDAGCTVATEILPESVSVENASRIERLPGFAEGFWTVQDESASAASLLLAPRPGERILDLCAAPGGKTTHLAELSDDAATIVACDVNDIRLKRIGQNVERLQLKSVTLHRISRNGEGLPSGPWDAVLVDVPCSNTGVLCRRPEARWRFDESELQELIQLQTRLLILACEQIAAGGRIVYSTCSQEPEENSGVVQTVLRAFPALKLSREQLHRAGQPADGAYQALIVHRDQN